MSVFQQHSGGNTPPSLFYVAAFPRFAKVSVPISHTNLTYPRARLVRGGSPPIPSRRRSRRRRRRRRERAREQEQGRERERGREKDDMCWYDRIPLHAQAQARILLLRPKDCQKHGEPGNKARRPRLSHSSKPTSTFRNPSLIGCTASRRRCVNCINGWMIPH